MTNNASETGYTLDYEDFFGIATEDIQDGDQWRAVICGGLSSVEGEFEYILARDKPV